MKTSLIAIVTFLLVFNYVKLNNNASHKSINYRSNDITDLVRKTIFKEYIEFLLRDGGIWETNDPKYESDKKYSAKTHKITYYRGIHSEIVSLKIESDLNDVGWYKGWEGYYLWHPVDKEIKYHAISGAGLISNGSIIHFDKNKKVNVFEILSYEGKKSIHKDVEVIVDQKTIKNSSYVLNKDGNWDLQGEFIWKRKIKD
ncbi:hypothetical protein [uncultured Psychroserpens sp.]|uniref:hypothetical protein n=1 Tax=uncultured Psychroserpens sp. TaxID=255436 RepID=UPI00260E37DA|nr:hypothetical protein [uncultured Psychroserpens sp.]